MDNNSTTVCHSIYHVIGNSVVVGVSIFGIISGILALITIPRLRLGILPAVLLFILALTDLIILGLQVPQVIVLENNYDSFAGSDLGTMPWYLRSYARRLRLTLYLFEGWMIICLTLNRFIFVRWPYYDGKYMTSKCAVISVVSLALFTLILEAPAFGKIVMSQLSETPKHTFTTLSHSFTTKSYLTELTSGFTTETTSDFSDTKTISPTTLEMSTAATISDHVSQNIASTLENDILTTLEHLTGTPMDSTSENENLVLNPLEVTTNSHTTDTNDEFTNNDSTLHLDHNKTNSTSDSTPRPKQAEPSFAGVVLKEILKIRDTYVEVLDRFVTTLVPIVVVVPFLAVMAAMLPGGHPRMRTLSHEVIMERSAVVIMLTGVTWYVIANLPYQVFSLVTWTSTIEFKCEADLLFHVTSITLACAFKPLIYFIVCPHFRRTLGAICTTKQKPKESFGTPSFDRISSRVFSSQDLDISRDSRDSRGSYFDLQQSTSL